MTACQTAVVAGSLTLPVFAPVLAADLGIDTKLVGYYASLIFFMAMLAALGTAGFIKRYGSLRVSQATLVFTALGLMAVPFGTLPALIASAVLIGLGFGPSNPASSPLLARLTPLHLRGLVFAVKQTSNTLGGALAGVTVPVLVALAGWRMTAVVVALACLALALAFQPWRRGLDEDRDRAASLRQLNLAAPLALVLGQPQLRALAFTGMGFAALQLCFATVYVAYLSDKAGLSLIAAGSALSTMLGVGVGGRLLWGWLGDHVPPRRVLAGLAVGMTLASVLLWLISPAWPYAAVLAVSALFGATAMSWNGVYYAAVTHHAPTGGIGDATSGVMFFVFLGALVAPASFSALATTTGGYTAGFVLLGLIVLVPGLMLLRPAPGSA